MSYEVSQYPHGTFNWVDFMSTDRDTAKTFYHALFGWTSEDMPTGEGQPDYTMFYLDGLDVAGGGPTFDPNMPTVWMSYISVDNVDEAVAKAEELGATTVMPAMDVLDSGRMATIQDPTGAHVSLWEPKKHIGARVVNKVGASCWNELYTKDVEKAKEFYGKLFGWEFSTDDTGYTFITNNGRGNGGIFEITDEMGNMPPFWMVYFTIENLEESVQKVQKLGGTVHMPGKEISVGKIAVVADPTGGAFTMIEMNDEPEHWTE